MQRVGTSLRGPSFLTRVNRNRGLYLLMLPGIVIFICFTYLPMYGVIIAFKDFRPAAGIWGSNWAGLKYFERYFNSYMFANTITNTLVISLYTIAVTFPLPILLALMVQGSGRLTERLQKRFQKNVKNGKKGVDNREVYRYTSFRQEGLSLNSMGIPKPVSESAFRIRTSEPGFRITISSQHSESGFRSGNDWKV